MSANGSPSITGTLNNFYGLFNPATLGTVENYRGLELALTADAGTINNMDGVAITLDSTGGSTLNSSNVHTGIDVTLTTDQTSGNDPTIYGVNVSATTGATGAPTAYGVRSTASGGGTNYSGYFYGSLFQVDDDVTVDTNNILATGTGDIYAVGDIEADGDLRLDGGDAAIRAASGNALVDVRTGDTTGYAVVSVIGVDDGGTPGGDWQMYTTAGAAAFSALGARTDLRWTIDGNMGGDDEMRLTTTGDLFVDTATNNGGADVAEVYQVADLSLSAGDVVNLTSAGALVAGTSESGALFGVVSTRPGVVLNNGANDTFDANERWIALSGRVPVKVNLEGGVIAPGDPLTSSSVAGQAKKANGLGMILGFALESYTGSESPIEVFMSLQWNPAGKIGLDGSMVAMNGDLAVSPLSQANASTTVYDSYGLTLRGSAYDGSSTINRDLQLKNVVTSDTEYRLSIRNTTDTEVAYVSETRTRAAGRRVRMTLRRCSHPRRRSNRGTSWCLRVRRSM
ncbi:MAG: hypothetical protein UY95_C0010G0014 [Parcubacteria group bacterium GW2011_GWA2_56_7]|nr:MAG: hypothetical protein UY95_C0010G0014 [Parcubacteria group bacterium GW2011_GWA2_56_7]